MQHAVDLDGADSSTLKRGKQHAAQRVTQRHAKAAFQRLGNYGSLALAVARGLDFQLHRADEFLPVLLVHMHFVRPSRVGLTRCKAPRKPQVYLKAAA